MDRASARSLLAGVVDYAGLFPPAGLPMADAVADYRAALEGPEAWMLGRFVLPASRLPDFAAARTAPGSPSGTWRLSAIVRDGSQEDRAAVDAFNAAPARQGALVDSVECRPATPAGIDWLAAAFGTHLQVFVEVAAAPDAAAWLERIAARGLRGKVRTGGLTADAFPSPDALVGVLEAAVRLGVPLKATAGLHHAVRGAYRLAYVPDAATAPMYGYLNVLLAAAALAAGQPAPVARALLVRTDTSSLAFGDEALRWGAVVLPPDALAQMRERQLVSFGSCSFREPAEEYRALASR